MPGYHETHPDTNANHEGAYGYAPMKHYHIAGSALSGRYGALAPVHHYGQNYMNHMHLANPMSLQTVYGVGFGVGSQHASVHPWSHPAKHHFGPYSALSYAYGYH